MKRALVLLAPLAEEMETTIVVDVLRRAGLYVVLAGVEGAAPVECSRGVRIVPDVSLVEVTGLFDALILPGGAGGAECLARTPAVGQLLRSHWEAERIVAAICAAPLALVAHGVATGRAVTSHPSVRERLAVSHRPSNERVVEDGNLVTSQGPGTSFEFALALVAKLCGPEKAEQVRGPMML